MKKRVDIHLTVEVSHENDGLMSKAIEEAVRPSLEKFNAFYRSMNIQHWRVRVLDSPTHVPRDVTPVPIMEDAISIINHDPLGPELNAVLEYPGCIVVKLTDKWGAWFGTANEFWGASIIDHTNNYLVDHPSAHGELLETDLPSTTHDPGEVADAILKAVKAWRVAHGE